MVPNFGFIVRKTRFAGLIATGGVVEIIAEMALRINGLDACHHRKLFREILLVFRVEGGIDGQFRIACRSCAPFCPPIVLEISIILDFQSRNHPDGKVVIVPKQLLTGGGIQEQAIIVRIIPLNAFGMSSSNKSAFQQIAVPPVPPRVSLLDFISKADFVGESQIIPLLVQVLGDG